MGITTLEFSNPKSSKMVIPPSAAVEWGRGGGRTHSSKMVIPPCGGGEGGWVTCGNLFLPINPPMW